MARSIRGLAFCLLPSLIGQSTAHFLLNYPPTIGFDDALEATPPCGSFHVNFTTDNVTDFHVGGDSLAMTSIHPQATWLFRATLDQTAGGNFTTLLPADRQTGLGDYCERDVMVPASFAGSKGVIQVVQDAPDGILYQVRQNPDKIHLSSPLTLSLLVCSSQLCRRRSIHHSKCLRQCDGPLRKLHHRPSTFESSRQRERNIKRLRRRLKLRLKRHRLRCQ